MTIWRDPPSYTPSQLAMTAWPLLSQILLSRGVSTAAEADAYLTPTTLPLGDPRLLPDMDRAVEMIQVAARAAEPVGIFGDYDVDGISSTAMLARALRTKLGAHVIPRVPHRIEDGYGLNTGAVEAFANAGCRLLITADCGTSDIAEIELALARGMRVIVLDHHRVHHDLPAEVAFVSPRRPDNRYPETELATAGVAYTLVRALLGDDGAAMYLPYATLGTVADVVTLQGENRALVARGLDALRRWTLPGFKTLCKAAGLDRRKVDAFDIGYIIGPRINAAGRMDTPDIALDWFLADDLPTSAPLSQRLENLNRARQSDTKRMLAEAELQVRTKYDAPDLPAIVVDGAGWNAGIIGIVAGRLAERFHRPAVVIARGTELSTGSARTAGGVDIVEAIRACRDLLERFGGHAAAAGLTIQTSSIDRFRSAMTEAVLAQLGGRLPQRELQLDAEIPHADLSLTTVDQLDVLEPCGHGNRRPLLLVRDVRPERVRTSRDGAHLLFDAIDRLGRRHQATFFNAGERHAELSTYRTIDLATELRRNHWNGKTRLQLRLTDFRPAESL